MVTCHTQKFDFEVFIVTSEPVEKVLPITSELENSELRTFATHVLSGASEIGDLKRIGDSIRVSHFPGESVFHLRSRISALARDCEWVVILEDHNLVDESWPGLVKSALDRCDPGTSVVVGAATNTRSTDKWSWANFLCVLGFHWAPEIRTPLEPCVFNIALKRALLGRERLALGQYEIEIVPLAMKAAQPDPSFPIDHMQFRRFPQVVYYHWCNGRVTGAGMREFTPNGMRHVYDHAHNTSFLRQRLLREALRRHPLKAELPRGTTMRTQLLAVAHSLGALYGGRFGVGRAPWALE
jgi:hypothetical protein